MTKRTRSKGSTTAKAGKYAFFLGSAAMLAGRAHAQTTLGLFTFETSAAPLTTAAVTAATFGPFAAESGTGTGFASHAATNTVYSSPAGSGSARSLSANVYAAGDYFQFSINATTYMNLNISFDQVASGTGPKTFNLAYSSTGTTGAFITLTTYSLNTGTATAFSTAAANSAVNFSFSLAGITALNNNANDVFRLVDADTVNTATGGTSRIDNVLVSSVPEPSAMTVSLLTAAGAGAAMLRRRRSSKQA